MSRTSPAFGLLLGRGDGDGVLLWKRCTCAWMQHCWVHHLKVVEGGELGRLDLKDSDCVSQDRGGSLRALVLADDRGEHLEGLGGLLHLGVEVLLDLVALADHALEESDERLGGVDGLVAGLATHRVVAVVAGQQGEVEVAHTLVVVLGEVVEVHGVGGVGLGECLELVHDLVRKCGGALSTQKWISLPGLMSSFFLRRRS